MIDHKVQAQSRVYAQYRDKPKFMAWIAINGDIANNFENAYEAIAGSYDIDTAGTDELDVIGRIVGVTRSFESQVTTLSYLWGAWQWGAAQYRPGKGTTDQDLNNDIYRLLIKAKIAKNNSDATIDGIILGLSTIFQTNVITVIDPEDMTFSLNFQTLTSTEQFVLDTFQIIPTPQGVGYTGYTIG